ncbi:unnamed protein product, partial [Brassica rapa]
VVILLLLLSKGFSASLLQTPPCEIVLAGVVVRISEKHVVLYINELKCTDLENLLDSCIRCEH